MLELPVERPLEEDELVAYLAEAIVNSRFNPGQDLPFHVSELLPRLGHGDAATRGKFLLANGGSAVFDLRVAQLCWRLVTLGFLTPQGWEKFAVTEPGREFLADNAEDAQVVLTPRGLARRLDNRCPNLDAVTSRYAGLAQDCFLAGHYHAAAVLLGVASEAALQRLADSIARVLPKLGITSSQRGDGAARTLDWLEEILRSHKKKIKKALDAATADSRWIDDLPRLLGPGTAIRLTRNEAGHPSDAAIDRSDAFRLFVLFPQMAEATFVTAAALETIDPN